MGRVAIEHTQRIQCAQTADLIAADLDDSMRATVTLPS